MSYIRKLEEHNNYLEDKLQESYKTIRKLCSINVETSNLIEASIHGHLAAVQFYVENGADVHVDEDHPVQSACLNGHLEIVKYLIVNGADVHADNDRALRWATKNGHRHIIDYLESLSGYIPLDTTRNFM